MDKQPAESPRPLFIYGTLCARPLLAWVITGSAENVSQVSPLLRRAKVTGYKRVAVRHCDYPAVVKDDGSVVDGFVVQLKTTSQRRKLDYFEGEAYNLVPVTAYLERTEETATQAQSDNNDDNNITQTIVDADMYLWDGDPEKLSTELWDLDIFIRTRLDDWINLFDGMELVGDDNI